MENTPKSKTIDEIYLQSVINGHSKNLNEKSAAIRHQGILLAQMTRDKPEAVKNFLLSDYLDSISDYRLTTTQEHAKESAKLLKKLNLPFPDNSKFQITMKPEDLIDKIPKLPCKGQYHNCKGAEVKESSLRALGELIARKRNPSLLENQSLSDLNAETNASESSLRALGDAITRKRSQSSLEKQPLSDSNAGACASPFSNTLTSTNIGNVSQASTSKQSVVPHPPRTLPQSIFKPRRPSSPPKTDTRDPTPSSCDFRTAKEELTIQQLKKNGNPSTSITTSRPLFAYGASKKSLGSRRNVRSGFVAPVVQEEKTVEVQESQAEVTDERLLNIDPKMIELITNEIMHKFKPIGWDDIAGLEYAKSTIKEAVVWPLLRPDIFTGLRRPPRGILLFGPPGTGKTLIGKCIASQSKSTFFSISASSLTSKWVGDGEKMVRALFAVAAVHQPSVVFIDEIDSLLSSRSETEHESSRRIKTEFLVQLDGAATSDDERILIVGATNRPQELDEAARRRLVRRLYIPLPELEPRVQILSKLLKTVRNSLETEEVRHVGQLTDGYSGADMETLCREASMEPIRSIPADLIPFFSEDKIRPISFDDFKTALSRVRASVSGNDLQLYIEWNRVYGAGSI